MSPFETDHPQQTDHHQHLGSPGDAPRQALSPAGSNADAAESAAHIAEMVRRTTQRLAAPSPSAVARPDVTAARRPSIPAASVSQPVAQPVAHPVAPLASQPVAPPASQPVAPPAPPRMRQPSPRALVAAAAVAAALIGSVVALSHPAGSEAGPAVSAHGRSESPVPAGYTVRVTDVITDCARHSRGRTKDSFEAQNCVRATRSLATGQVNGRLALFVTSRVQMASAEAATSVRRVLDGNGTGNLTDLLREGRTFPGAPEAMPTSGYVSVQTAKVVTVAEAGFADGGRSSATDTALRAAAAQVATLVDAQS